MHVMCKCPVHACTFEMSNHMQSIWNSAWHFILGLTTPSGCFYWSNVDVWFHLISAQYVLTTINFVSVFVCV